MRYFEKYAASKVKRQNAERVFEIVDSLSWTRGGILHKVTPKRSQPSVSGQKETSADTVQTGVDGQFVSESRQAC